jgi:2-keto-4-pentenoate hydratase
MGQIRLSTEKQGASGLGLEAQQEAVERHVRTAGGRILDVFQEIASGKRNDRPEIAAAIAACRSRRATLVIAKLNRLARNVAFVSNLMEAGIEFVAYRPAASGYRVGHPASGRIWLAVDGQVKQDSGIAKLIWPVPDIISITSRSMELRPGDIIMTGTPEGAGPVQRGETMTGGIDGLGEIRIVVR